MDLYTFLRSYMTVSWVAKLVERMPKRTSVIYDSVFKKRNNNPSAYVRVDEILQSIGSVPMVSRGGASVRAAGSEMSTGLIEPMPIRLNEMLTGARLNDLRSMYQNGSDRGQRLVQSEIDRLTMKLMGQTQKTRDALCAQAMTGKIDYQMIADGAYTRYVVDFGAPLTYAPTKKWNADGTKIGDVLSQLITIKQKLAEQGFSGNVLHMAPSDTWVALANLVTNLPNDQRMGASVENNVITVSGFKIFLDDGSYADRDAAGSVVVKPEIEAKKLLSWVEDMPQIEYCAIDDIDGNLEAVPFFSKPIQSPDPSGVKIVSESKPLPLIAPKAVCWSTVLN